MIFIRLLGWPPAGRHAAAAGCLCNSAPHWAPVFCCGLTTPNTGVAQALGLWWWIETKAQMMVYRCFIQGDQGMVPENS